MARRLADTIGRGASLILTDRRWGATLSASALGFGLFVGVAIGPGAAGTLATGTQQVIEIPSLLADGGEAGAGGAVASSGSPSNPSASLATGGEAGSLETLPPLAPLAAGSTEPPPPPAAEPAPAAKHPVGEEPQEPEATELDGTVVAATPAAGAYALAIEGGELVPVHAAELPRPGAKLTVEAVQLANGTFAEMERSKRGGEVKQVAFRGAVTFVDADPAAPAYTVSGRGASLRVEVTPDPAGVLPPLPGLGSYVTARVAIEADASLLQRELELEPGEPATYLDLAGIYAGLSPETGQVLISADGSRAGEKDLALAIPPGIDHSLLKPGDSYLATATVEPDGTLTLAGIASDERRKGADDAGSAQGDLKR